MRRPWGLSGLCSAPSFARMDGACRHTTPPHGRRQRTPMCVLGAGVFVVGDARELWPFLVCLCYSYKRVSRMRMGSSPTLVSNRNTSPAHPNVCLGQEGRGAVSSRWDGREQEGSFLGDISMQY